MADDVKKAGGGQGQAEAVEAAKAVGTDSENQSTQERGADEVLTLTVKELQSRIDKEVAKALKTRTANLQKELEEARAELERLKKEAAPQTETERLAALTREYEQAFVAYL